MRHPADLPLPTTLGGFRLVRVLGRDEVVTSALVFADGEARMARVFHHSVDGAVMEAELAVHDALAAGPPEVRQHVAAVDDLVTLADGRLALLGTAVTGPTLQGLLQARHGALELGEVVTVLAPMVALIEGAHHLGVTGISLDPRVIRFAASGAPVVVSVGGAVAGPVLPARFRDQEPAYRDDHRAIAHLVRAVSWATPPHVQSALQTVVGHARGDQATVSSLFDLATPVPVRRDEGGAAGELASSGAVPSGAERRGDADIAPPLPLEPAAPPESATRSVLATIAALASVMTVLGVPTRITETVVQTAEQVARRAERPWASVSSRFGGRAAAAARPSARRASRAPVRRSFVVAGGAGAVALVLAVVVSVISSPPSGGGSSVPEPAPTPFPARTGPPDVAAREHALPENALWPEPAEWRPLVAELVGRWGECQERLSDPVPSDVENCGVRVAHPGSAAETMLGDADDARHAVLSAWLSQGGEVVVVEKMGAAVLVDLIDDGSQTTAASLLVIRSEAGWRVRDVRG